MADPKRVVAENLPAIGEHLLRVVTDWVISAGIHGGRLRWQRQQAERQTRRTSRRPPSICAA